MTRLTEDDVRQIVHAEVGDLVRVLVTEGIKAEHERKLNDLFGRKSVFEDDPATPFDPTVKIGPIPPVINIHFTSGAVTAKAVAEAAEQIRLYIDQRGTGGRR